MVREKRDEVDTSRGHGEGRGAHEAEQNVEMLSSSFTKAKVLAPEAIQRCYGQAA